LLMARSAGNGELHSAMGQGRFCRGGRTPWNIELSALVWMITFRVK